MNARTSFGRPLAGLSVVFLLAGCGAGASPTQVPATPAPLATGAAAAAAAATPAFTPSAPDRTYVSGTMSCHIVGEEDPTATGTYGDLAPGGLDIDCDYRMSDPRVTGTEHYKLQATFVGLEAVNGTSNFWGGTSTLETKDGTWTGSGFGSEFVSEPIKPMTLFTSGTDLLQGQGAFAGLTYRVLWARERSMSAPGAASYVVSGWIEPAE